MSARDGSSLLAHASVIGSQEPPYLQSLRRGIPDGARILQMMEQMILTLHVNFSSFRSKFQDSSDHLPVEECCLAYQLWLCIDVVARGAVRVITASLVSLLCTWETSFISAFA